MPPERFEHFADYSITLIDKTDDSDPTTREEYWRNVLKTITTQGLNILN